MPLRRLWTDQEIAGGTSLGAVLRRNAGECARDVVAAARAAVGRGRLTAPALVLGYFAGMAARPLQSDRMVELPLEGPHGTVRSLVRLSQSDLYIWREVFLEGIYDFPYGPVGTVVDLGANAGLVSTWYASRYPEARIVSVEPMVENVEVIREACRRAGGDWIIEQAAVDSQSGTTEFYSSSWWSSGSALAHIGHARQDQANRVEHDTRLPVRSVPMVSMDDLVARHGLERIDVLKVDIEGAEEALLCEGGREWLRRVRWIIIEIHDRYVDGARIQAALRSAGFDRREHHGPCSVWEAAAPPEAAA